MATEFIRQYCEVGRLTVLLVALAFSAAEFALLHRDAHAPALLVAAVETGPGGELNAEVAAQR